MRTPDINWKEEAEVINSYSDFQIQETKEGVLDYLEFIISVNGTEYLFTNEKELLKKTGLDKEWEIEDDIC